MFSHLAFRDVFDYPGGLRHWTMCNKIEDLAPAIYDKNFKRMRTLGN